MQYTTRKVRHKIVHIPDTDMRKALEGKLGLITGCKSEISSFKRRGGIKLLLARHSGDRFFVIIDLVHAFHQITREMVASVFAEVAEPRFDICFVEMAGKLVLPMGAVTSGHLFEKFMSRAIDLALIEWQEKFGGHVTRHADNVLCTWRVNAGEGFEALKMIFGDLEVRTTPQKPRKRKVANPIRFLGLVVPTEGKIHIPKSAAKRIIEKARRGKSTKSIDGAMKYVDNNR